jgi:para-nitrobenzyl esterase
VVGTAIFPEVPNIAIAKGSARIPYIVGCSMHEAASSVGAMVKTASEEDLQKRITGSAGAHAAEMIAGYRKNHPDFSPGELLLRILSDGTRFASIKAAEAHIQGGGESTYMYLFDWESPRLPTQRAAHASDCSFYFGNTEVLGMSRGIPEAQQLSVKMSSAWATFARVGNPATADLGWLAYATDQRSTMLWIATPHVASDPLGADRLIWEKLLSA